MSDSIHSQLLKAIIKEAPTCGKEPYFTMERVMVIVLSILLGNSKMKLTKGMLEEIEMVRESVGCVFPASTTAMCELVEFVYGPYGNDANAEIYMHNLVKEAGKQAAKDGRSKVCIYDLVELMFRYPTPSFEKIVLKAGKPEALAVFMNKEDTADSQTTAGGTRRTSVVKPYRVRKKAPGSPTKEAIGELVREIRRMRTELQSVLYGQDHAIDVFLAGYFRASVSVLLNTSRDVGASFLFAGPPGVGKTYMAQQIAEVLNDRPFRRFDMSEYADKESPLEFCGSDQVYRGGAPGNVTGFVKDHPRCVLLFDEIEKAHVNVIHLFLQVLDAGVLRDSYYDEEVSFKEAIIIFTTNAGKQLYEDSETADLSQIPQKLIIRALEKDVDPKTDTPFFPAAICSRFAAGNVVMFNHMDARGLSRIAKGQIERGLDGLDFASITHEIDNTVPVALMFSEGGAADARTIQARAKAFVYEELYELFRLMESDKIEANAEDIRRVRMEADLRRASSEVRGYFEPPQTERVLVFADEETVEQCRHQCPSCEFIGAQTAKDAMSVVKLQAVAAVLVDIRCGAYEDGAATLNAEDTASAAMDFLGVVHEKRQDLPLYLLTTPDTVLSDEERLSFRKQGVLGDVGISQEENDGFSERLCEIVRGLHHQTGMKKLAVENKRISFKTAQTYEEKTHTAVITLYGFRMSVAVEAEDAESVLTETSRPDVHFDDVIGAGDAKRDLTAYVKYLKDPQAYTEVGAKAPKGVLLYGPPGTGKTMLAKALACESNVTFVATEGNAFLKAGTGNGAQEVHRLFRIARKYAPSVLFIDEIDAIAKERTGYGSSEDTLTALLTEMDGFRSDSSRPVFVLAATNFRVDPGTAKSLDPALMRRFDRRIYVDLPKKEDRICFLYKKMKENKALALSESMAENVAVRSTGMSLAELEAVIEFALRTAVIGGNTVADDAVFEEAFEIFRGGEAVKWDDAVLERTARHEAGHAVLCWLNGETPSYLTVVARSDHGGYMQHTEQEGKALYTKEELLALIRTKLGGRAAELVYYGEADGVSTGAGGDLESATRLARQMICLYGMDEEFGPAAVFGSDAEQAAMSVQIRTVVNRILQEQLCQAVQLIKDNREKVDCLAQALLTKNHLSGEEIAEVLTQTGKRL